MNREQVLATLRAHEPTLKAAVVVHLSLFGSTARGDRRPDSDVDLLAAFDRTRRISLLDVAGIEIRGIARATGGSDRGRNAQAAYSENRRGRGRACLLKTPLSDSKT